MTKNPMRKRKIEIIDLNSNVSSAIQLQILIHYIRTCTKLRTPFAFCAKARDVLHLVARILIKTCNALINSCAGFLATLLAALPLSCISCGPLISRLHHHATCCVARTSACVSGSLVCSRTCCVKRAFVTVFCGPRLMLLSLSFWTLGLATDVFVSKAVSDPRARKSVCIF